MDFGKYRNRVLITGIAGFIGFHLACAIVEANKGKNETAILGLDNMNDYYAVSLKRERLAILEALIKKHPSFGYVFFEKDICDKETMEDIFKSFRPTIVVNLAAQAGVRYSITNPDAYISSNVVGFFNILECCRRFPVEHLVYASSSSVYGGNTKIPYSVADKTDCPVSLYAATKKTDELLAAAYAKLYQIPCTGLRFFTVYGPYGRPDMAYFSFASKLLHGETIKIFNHGKCYRDFTYVDDIVKGIMLVMGNPPCVTDSNNVPSRLYNIGNGHPESLLDFVDILERELIATGLLPSDYDFSAHKKLVPMQPGDVAITYADTSDLERDFGYKPTTCLRDGLRLFVQWFAASRQSRE